MWLGVSLGVDILDKKKIIKKSLYYFILVALNLF